MAVTSGFFNAIKGDRKYNSLQMAELFDGLINDGVYETIYNQFRVSPNEGLAVQVDTGRGWFKHTWIKNDNLKILRLEDPHVLYNRIDAVVIEVDHTDPGRIDRIKIVTGTPSASPVRPTLSKTDEIWQVPLAYIAVNYNTVDITASNITNMIGTSECPFVTGVVSVMDIDMLVEQWQSQWNDRLKDNEKEFDSWFYEMKDRMVDYESDFKLWFSRLKDLLDDDAAAKLAARLLEIEDMLKMLLHNGMMLSTIDDSNDDPIIDSYGLPINGYVSVMMDQNDCTCPNPSSIPNSYIDSFFS